MPMYDYRCSQCGHKIEELIFSWEEKEIVCPECKTLQVERLMGAPATISGSAPACEREGCPTPAGSGFS